MGDNQTLKFGDLIFIFSKVDEDGYISTSSFSEANVVVNGDKDENCIFKIVPKIQYIGDTDEISAKDGVLRNQWIGKEIIYGQIFQFQHVKTKRFLSSQDMDLNDDGVWNVSLEKKGTNKCWYKFSAHTNSNDKVTLSTRLKIEHVQTGCYLHQSSNINSDKSYEVDMEFSSESGMSSDLTLWEILHSDIEGGFRESVKNGDILKFYHEQFGYLYGDPKKMAVQVRTLQRDEDPNIFSFHTLWQVTNHTDNEAKWNHVYQLKLFGTELYLSVLENDVSEEGDSKPYLNNDPSDPGTHFSFIPTKKYSDSEIPIGQATLIKSVLNSWMHCTGDSELSLIKKMNSKDIFSIQAAPSYQVDDINFLDAKLNQLESFIFDLDNAIKNESKKRITPKQVRKILQELVIWLIPDLDRNSELIYDTLIKKFVVDKSRQYLLGTENFMSAILTIAEIGPRQDILTTQFAYSLLGNISRNNADGAAFIIEHLRLPIFIVPDPVLISYYRLVPLPHTILSIYANNKHLLYNLSEDTVRKIFDVIRITKDHQYITVLRKFCRQGTLTIPRNQTMICSILVEDYSDIVFKTEVNKDEKSRVLIHYKGKPMDMALFTALKSEEERHDIRFHLNILRLYSDMCIDRNIFCVNIINKSTYKHIGCDFKETFNCVKDEYMDRVIRAAYCEIALHTFLYNDMGDPNKSKFKKVWLIPRDIVHDDGAEDEQYRIDTAGGLKLQDSESDYEGQISISNIQDICIKEIFDKYNFKFDEVQISIGQGIFVKRIMELMKQAFLSSGFSRKEVYVVSRLVKILDEMNPYSVIDSAGTIKQRVIDNKTAKTMINIRLIILSMIDRYLDLILTTDVAHTLYQKFYVDMGETEIKGYVLDILHEFDPKETLNVKGSLNLVRTLINQMQYENSVLSYEAIRLARRVILSTCSFSNIAQVMGELRILTGEQGTNVFNLLKNNSARLRAQICTIIDGINGALIITEAIDNLTVFCEENPDNQALCRQFDIHHVILDIINGPISTKSDKEDVEETIILACYHFFSIFLKDNEENQMELFDYLEIVIHQMSLFRYNPRISEMICTALIELFSNNMKLCKKVPESLLENIFFLTTQFEEPIFIKFFKVIINPGGKLIKMNQNIVLNIFIRSEQILATIQGFGITEFNQDKELYLSELIYLLSLCCEGRNYYTEVTCQRIISLELAVDICFKYRRLSHSIFVAYAFFIDEVYLNTDIAIQVLPIIQNLDKNTSFWKILDHFKRHIDSITRHSEQGEDESIFKVILPFFIHYFDIGFNVDNIQKKSYINQANDIIDVVYKLRQKYRKNIPKLKSATHTIKSIYDAGIVGHKYRDEISKLVNSVVIRDNYMEMLLKFAEEKKEKFSHNNLQVVNNTTKEEINRISDLSHSTVGSKLVKEFLRIDQVSVGDEMEEEIISPTRVTSLDNIQDISPRRFIELLKTELSSAESSEFSKVQVIELFICYINEDKPKLSELELELLHRRQDTLAKLEAPTLIIEQLTSSSDDLVSLAFNALFLMLNNRDVTTGVNSIVADDIIQNLSSGSTEFFNIIKFFFEDAKEKIREHKKKTVYTRDKDLGHSNNYGTETELVFSKKLLYILKVLELLAQGVHGTRFKRILLASQWDITREIVTLIKIFTPHISISNIDIAVQLFITLRQLVTKSPRNQHITVSNQVLNPVNTILATSYAQTEQGTDPVMEEFDLNLKITTVNFVLSLTEDCETHILHSVLTSIDPEVLVKNTESITNPLFLNNELVVNLASLSFKLVKLLAHEQEHSNRHFSGIQEAAEKCELYCKNRIGSVEVIHETKIKRIYFPIPESYTPDMSLPRKQFLCCGKTLALDAAELSAKQDKKLTRDLEKYLQEKDVNWSKGSEKIEAFSDWAANSLIEREFAPKQTNITKFFKAWPNVLWNLSSVFGFLVNFIIILQRGDEDEQENVHPYTVLEKIFGLIAMICNSLLLLFVILEKGGRINRGKWWKRFSKRGNVKIFLQWKDLVASQEVSKTSYNLLSFMHVVTDKTVIIYTLFLLFAILGVFLNHYFFAFLIVQNLIRSSQVKDILKALYTNASRLMLMVFLILYFVYLFSIFTFLAFKDQYLQSDIPCETLFQCFMSTLYYGVPSEGGLFEFVTPFAIDPWNQDITTRGYFWIAGITLFYFIMAMILLNVVFAIIVDTFQELREKRGEAKDELSNSCFICSLDRETFSKYSKDYSKHVESEHNTLHYLYFHGYLKQKTALEKLDTLSVIERDTYETIIMGRSIKVFPIGRAMAIEEDRDDHLNDDILKSVDSLESDISESQLSQDKLNKRTAELYRTFHTIEKELSSLNSDLKSLS